MVTTMQKAAKVMLSRDEELYRRIKHACVEKGVTITEALREAMEEWLKKNEE